MRTFFGMQDFHANITFPPTYFLAFVVTVSVEATIFILSISSEILQILRTCTSYIPKEVFKRVIAADCDDHGIGLPGPIQRPRKCI